MNIERLSEGSYSLKSPKMFLRNGQNPYDLFLTACDPYYFGFPEHVVFFHYRNE